MQGGHAHGLLQKFARPLRPATLTGPPRLGRMRLVPTVAGAVAADFSCGPGRDLTEMGRRRRSRDADEFAVRAVQLSTVRTPPVVVRRALFELLSAGVTLVSAPPGSGKTVLLRSWIDQRASATTSPGCPSSAASETRSGSGSRGRAAARRLRRGRVRGEARRRRRTSTGARSSSAWSPSSARWTSRSCWSSTTCTSCAPRGARAARAPARPPAPAAPRRAGDPPRPAAGPASPAPRRPADRGPGRRPALLARRDARAARHVGGRAVRTRALPCSTPGPRAGPPGCGWPPSRSPGIREPERFVAEFSGSERTVADYLLAEVLERQPDEVRRLLLRTSILERVNGALADVLVGASGSERILLRAGAGERVRRRARRRAVVVPLPPPLRGPAAPGAAPDRARRRRAAAPGRRRVVRGARVRRRGRPARPGRRGLGARPRLLVDGTFSLCSTGRTRRSAR